MRRCANNFMKIYKRAMPDSLRDTQRPRGRAGGSSGPNCLIGQGQGTSSDPVTHMTVLASKPTNQFAEYVCGRPAVNMPLKHMRRAPVDAPEWYGCDDDTVLIKIWEHLPVTDGFKHRKLSRQMRRVSRTSTALLTHSELLPPPLHPV